ncbi:hypothetical protein LTS18_007838 [Coniosporium uncinatum]|uniref:Uncharacterized protein n=1 Tax=Coniosporium uncinatum TaxID=93489 RepID=A0ACC3E0A6_9PEZI|nr:hypothetical protein LTS18_007838 [Coniosporium uncinatum]
MHSISNLPTLLTLTIFTTLASTSPITLPSTSPHIRAGGPIGKPVPSNCTVSSPLPTTNDTATNSTASYKPTAARLNTTLYEYYLPPSTATYQNSTTLFTNCLEQCYGYGYTGDCKAAYLAYDVPQPPLYGAPGGNPSIACLMWAKPLTSGDFEEMAGTGNWTGAVVGDISCPSA